MSSVSGVHPPQVPTGSRAGRGAAEISVVVPVYCDPDSITELYCRLCAAVAPLVDDFELILVDDGSPDSWPLLRELSRTDARVLALRLSRNFGQDAAITAGLVHSSGRFTVVMDWEQRDPPEQIANLYATALAGHDVVLTRRPHRRARLLRRVSGAIYFRVRKLLVGGILEHNMTNLSLLSRRAIDAYLSLGELHRPYLLIVDWLGFRRAVIDIEQDEHAPVTGSYSWGALVRVAIDGIFFQSTQVLRWIVYAGFAIATLGLTLLAYALAVFIGGRTLPQWTALPILILLLTGFITIAGGITSLYVGKIFDQVKGRPLYVVETEIVDGVARSQARQLAPSGSASHEQQ